MSISKILSIAISFYHHCKKCHAPIESIRICSEMYVFNPTFVDCSTHMKTHNVRTDIIPVHVRSFLFSSFLCVCPVSFSQFVLLSDSILIFDSSFLSKSQFQCNVRTNLMRVLLEFVRMLRYYSCSW